MKYLIQFVTAIGLTFAVSGCSTTTQSPLGGLNGNGCNNPKCQCPKPCQCGPRCSCGTKGNSMKMNGN